MNSEQRSMDEQPPPLPRNPVCQLILGILVANAVGGALLYPAAWAIRTFKEEDLATLIAWDYEHDQDHEQEWRATPHGFEP